MKGTHKFLKYFKNVGCCIALLTAMCFTLLSTASSAPSSRKHNKYAELTCKDCHFKTTPEPLTTKQCLSCHGSFEELAEKTKHLDPDPHNSPHYGSKLDCDLCHHEHSMSENFCAQCHEWELTVP